MNEEIYLSEKKKLKEVLIEYKNIIEDYNQMMESLPRVNHDNPDLMISLMNQYGKKLDLLNKSINKPYFARIDFKSEDEKRTDICYIGKVGVLDSNNNVVTVDWRAPISSMYYDSNIGTASYEAPKGIITGQLLVKRQYDIENGVLNGFQDVDTVSNDDILKPYLGVTADNRLKNIVASIQTEQNQIIREKINKNLIIQGVAGSGKTTVALHRIAYLVYNNIKNIKPSQYMVIGPNKFFLNYISSVLPDLDVNNVEQLTYDELTREFINENFKVNSVESKLILSIVEKNDLSLDRYKTSMLYKDALDKYMEDFDRGVVPTSDFLIKGFTILPYDIVKQVYDEVDKDHYKSIRARVERASLILSSIIERSADKILSSVSHTSYEMFKSALGDQIKIDKIHKDTDFVKKEINNFCKQSLKKHFSKSSTKIFTMYADFIKDTENYILMDEFSISNFKKKTLKNIKNKSVDFEDLGALLYLKCKLSGTEGYQKYRHTVIDEAQDYGEFNFYVLNHMMPNCTFSIFGDLAQSIYDYRSIDSWDEVVEQSFNNNCDIRELLKSYRTTTEIMNSANNITEHLSLNSATPVIRHGQEVSFAECYNDKAKQIIQKIYDFVEKGHKSIAIISKTADETTILNQQLANLELKVDNIISADTEYHGGICTITSYLAKGLEFDAVLISNASELEYSSSRAVDMKLLYVAMTRPLHELTVLYEGELTKPLQNCLNIETNNGRSK